jgi:hypothetical protein
VLFVFAFKSEGQTSLLPMSYPPLSFGDDEVELVEPLSDKDYLRIYIKNQSTSIWYELFKTSSKLEENNVFVSFYPHENQDVITLKREKIESEKEHLTYTFKPYEMRTLFKNSKNTLELVCFYDFNKGKIVTVTYFNEENKGEVRDNKELIEEIMSSSYILRKREEVNKGVKNQSESLK